MTKVPELFSKTYNFPLCPIFCITHRIAVFRLFKPTTAEFEWQKPNYEYE